MKKINVIVLLIILLHLQAWGQEEDVMEALKYTPHQVKSPEAAMIERYGYYPVDLSVGLTNISIPIYTIKTGQIEFPINLSYHMGGIKVDDIASWTGLGWILNASGSICRNVLGLPDESQSGILATKGVYKELIGNDQKTIRMPFPMQKSCMDKVDKLNQWETIQRLLLDVQENNGIDAGSDSYSYQANNIVGSFVYGTDINRELIQIPHSDNVIIRKQELDGSGKSYYEIVGNDGAIYIFRYYETSFLKPSDEAGMNYISRWMLSSLISPNKADTLTFTYSNYNSQDYSISAALYEGDHAQPTIIPSKDNPSSTVTSWNLSETNNIGTSYSVTSVNSNEAYLDKILFRGGEIEFVKSTDRRDVRTVKLDAIIVRNKIGEQVKKILFEYDYFKSEQGSIDVDEKYCLRLKLSNIKEWGRDNSEDPLIHRFSYNEEVILPHYFDIGDRYQKLYFGQDHWGFYNGVRTNAHLVGVSSINTTTALKKEFANMAPNEKYMKACVLEKIDYPTGGYTIFETEANRNKDNVVYGGLRISKIISQPKEGMQGSIQKYTYEDADIIYEPEPSNYSYDSHIRILPGEIIGTKVIYTQSPFFSIGLYNGSSIVYKKVTKTDMDSNNEFNGKIIYYYPGAIFFSNTNYNMSGPFLNFNGSGSLDIDRYGFTPVTWAMGKPLKEEYFKKDGVCAKIVEYEYLDHEQKWNFDSTNAVNTAPIGVRVALKVNDYLNDLPDGGLGTNSGYHLRDITSDWSFSWLYTHSGIKKLKRKKESVYDQSTGQYITTETEYSYDNIDTGTKRNLFLTQKKVMGSNSEVLIEKYFYPQDYSDSISKNMIENNYLNYLMETQLYHSLGIIKKNILTRKRIYNSRFLPAADISVYNGVPCIDATYDLYDNRCNLRQLTTADGLSTVFLWGYSSQFPIAEIKNATFANVVSNITENEINAIAIRPILLGSDSIKLNELRAKMKDSDVVLYNYNPLVGIKNITYPDGVPTHYFYDGFNRLKNIKDMKTNSTHTYEYAYSGKAYDKIVVDFLVQPNYFINKSHLFTVTASGGSGFFTYKWIITTATGTVILETAYSSSSTLNKIFNEQHVGQLILCCIVKDARSGVEKSVSKTINIIKPPVEFTSIKNGGYDSNGNIEIYAEVSCYEKATVRFYLECTTAIPDDKLVLKIGPKTYTFSEGTSCSIDIDLTTPITVVTMNATPASGGYVSASLSIEKVVTGNLTIGQNNYMSFY